MRNIRTESPSGYYHVMKRGAGKQIIFEDRSDYTMFLQQLQKRQEKFEVKIAAFCLMSNHFHLLLKSGTAEEISRFMQSIGTAYAMYFNSKYCHVGPVFQGRYESRLIDNLHYFMKCIRYIHNNPEEAGIAERDNYEWSSYQYYAGGKVALNGLIIETQDLMEMLGGIAEFKEFSRVIDKDSEEDDKWTDRSQVEHANYIIREYCGNEFESIFSVKQLGKKDRDEIVRRLKRAGIRARQIELMTGISRDIVRRIK